MAGNPALSKQVVQELSAKDKLKEKLLDAFGGIGQTPQLPQAAAGQIGQLPSGLPTGPPGSAEAAIQPQQAPQTDPREVLRNIGIVSSALGTGQGPAEIGTLPELPPAPSPARTGGEFAPVLAPDPAPVPTVAPLLAPGQIGTLPGVEALPTQPSRTGGEFASLEGGVEEQTRRLRAEQLLGRPITGTEPGVTVDSVLAAFQQSLPQPIGQGDATLLQSLIDADPSRAGRESVLRTRGGVEATGLPPTQTSQVAPLPAEPGPRQVGGGAATRQAEALGIPNFMQQLRDATSLSDPAKLVPPNLGLADEAFEKARPKEPKEISRERRLIAFFGGLAEGAAASGNPLLESGAQVLARMGAAASRAVGDLKKEERARFDKFTEAEQEFALTEFSREMLIAQGAADSINEDNKLLREVEAKRATLAVQGIRLLLQKEGLDVQKFIARSRASLNKALTKKAEAAAAGTGGPDKVALSVGSKVVKGLDPRDPIVLVNAALDSNPNLKDRAEFRGMHALLKRLGLLQGERDLPEVVFSGLTPYNPEQRRILETAFGRAISTNPGLAEELALETLRQGPDVVGSELKAQEARAANLGKPRPPAPAAPLATRTFAPTL